MANGGRAALSDEQVRLIKANLVLGVTCAALARAYDVGEETIGRIRRGLTYRHVKVAGEEALRPEVKMEAPSEAMRVVMGGMSEEELERKEGELLAQMERDLEKEKVVKGARDEVAQMALEKYLGNTPLAGEDQA